MKHSITYAGRVTIKVKNQPPVRKTNAGTASLFSLLCNFMSGNLTNNFNNKLPVKITMIHDSNGEITPEILSTNLCSRNYSDQSLLISDLNITGVKINSETSSVCYSCLLLHSQLKTSSRGLAESGTCYVLLINNENSETDRNEDINDILAYSAFDYSDISGIWEDTNGQGAVEWEMFFANKEA